MKTRTFGFLFFLFAACLIILASGHAMAQKPIVIGAPLSTAFLYGWDAERGIKLAVEEINAAGGVQVGKEKRPFKVEVIDTRDLEPGVPVSEALMAVEKLILEKKADFMIGGPVRSEAALAAMDLLSKYKKVSILTTGVLTPAYHARVEKEYDKSQVLLPDTRGSGAAREGDHGLLQGDPGKARAQQGLHHGPGRGPRPGRRRDHRQDRRRAGLDGDRDRRSIPPGPPISPWAS